MFKYATGKCVSQKTYQGQQLMAVKKYNDAKLAMENAQRVLETPPTFDDDVYAQMLGGSDTITSVQRNFGAAQANYRLKRQQQLLKDMAAASALRLANKGSPSCRAYKKPARSGFMSFFGKIVEV